MKAVVIIDPRLSMLVQRTGGIEPPVSNYLECAVRDTEHAVISISIGEATDQARADRFILIVGFAAVAKAPRLELLFGDFHTQRAQRSIMMVQNLRVCMDDERMKTHARGRATR